MEPTSNELSQAIILAPMREREQIRSPGEDWTGVTSTLERRKLQNRLNQRAARMRKKLLIMSEWPLVDQAAEIIAIRSQSASDDPNGDLDSFITARLAQTIRRFANETYLRSLRRSPCLEYLPTVIHVNVLNALAGNSHALGLSHLWLFCDAISPICQTGPLLGPSFQGLISCPNNLQPTRLQLEIGHHPWIDLLPIPQLRDNVIRGCVVTQRFDEDELWYDLVEMKSAERDDGSGESHSPSLLMWGKNPWDTNGWEATGAFLRKWGFLLEGCEQVLESTNHWRIKRGEKSISMTWRQEH